MQAWGGEVLKRALRRALKYRGLPGTGPVRERLALVRRTGWPYCLDDEGDVLFRLAESIGEQDALEIGFATGSSAAYMLSGLTTGRLTSIDYDQDHFEREGEKLVAAMGFTPRHRLIEQDSILALPALNEAGSRFGLVFVDGWKTFDRLWVDTFYCVRMLDRGGYIVFDDAAMPAVCKCISLLKRYYGFGDVDTYPMAGGWKCRMWHVLVTRSWRRPYRALRKTMDLDDTVAGRQFDFWKRF